MEALTESQERVLNFIREYIEANQRPPTFTDIMNGVGIARNTAQYHVVVLEDKGWIETTPGIARSIKILY